MSSYQIPGRVVPLKERTRAPSLTEEDALMALITAAVKAAQDESDRKWVKEVRELTARVERGFQRVADSLEGFVAGQHDVAVASMVDGETDDLPSVSRLKAEATLIYTLTASDIAASLNVPMWAVSFLLNKTGLNWIERKPDLWNQKLHTKTKRRLWHPKTIELLRAVFADPNHPEREGLGQGCHALLCRIAGGEVAAPSRANDPSGRPV